MKNLKRSVLGLAMLGVAVLPMHSAHSVLGFPLGVPALSFIGLLMMYSLPWPYEEGNRSCSGGCMIGLVLFDGQNGQELQFAPIQPEQAGALGLSTQELVAYNSELERINLVRDEASAAQSAEESKTIWISHQSDLSPEAFSAASKIARAAFL